MAEPQPVNSHSIDSLVEHVRDLPKADQVDLIRRIAPMILGSLDDADRNELVSDLNTAIARSSVAARR